MIASRKRSGGKPPPRRQRRDQDRRHRRLGDQQLAAAERDGGAHREHDHDPRLPRPGADRGHDQVGDRDPEDHAADELERPLAALPDRRAERDHGGDRREQRPVAAQQGERQVPRGHRRRGRLDDRPHAAAQTAAGELQRGHPWLVPERSILRGAARPWLGTGRGKAVRVLSVAPPAFRLGLAGDRVREPGDRERADARGLVARHGRDQRRLLRRARLGERDHCSTSGAADAEIVGGGDRPAVEVRRTDEFAFGRRAESRRDGRGRRADDLLALPAQRGAARLQGPLPRDRARQRAGHGPDDLRRRALHRLPRLGVGRHGQRRRRPSRASAASRCAPAPSPAT